MRHRRLCRLIALSCASLRLIMYVVFCPYLLDVCADLCLAGSTRNWSKMTVRQIRYSTFSWTTHVGMCVEGTSPQFVLTTMSSCFLYLFPSHVSWYLTATLVFFT